MGLSGSIVCNVKNICGAFLFIGGLFMWTLHVDPGVAKYNRGGLAAAICRDEHIHYLGSSSVVVLGVHDSAILEAIACREAFALKTLHCKVLS